MIWATAVTGISSPNGGWGYSNAGLIEDQGETLLIDTLMDLPLTRDMLDSMKRAVPAAERIGTLLNTHSNPDHTFGNQLVEGAVIISSDACLEEMKEHSAPSDDPRGKHPNELGKFRGCGEILQRGHVDQVFRPRGSFRPFQPILFPVNKTIHVGRQGGPIHRSGAGRIPKATSSSTSPRTGSSSRATFCSWTAIPSFDADPATIGSRPAI